jgi:hypothetical protein
MAKDNSRGPIRLESSQIKWFMRWPGREAGLGDCQPKTLKTKLSPRGMIRLEYIEIRWFV